MKNLKHINEFSISENKSSDLDELQRIEDKLFDLPQKKRAEWGAYSDKILKSKGAEDWDELDDAAISKILGAAKQFLAKNENIEEAVNLKQSRLSSAEYQKAKKLKGFDKNDWEWNPIIGLYVKVNKKTNENMTSPLETNFDDFVNEAARTKVEVRLAVKEPYKKRDEVKAAMNFKIVTHITPTNVDGIIDEDSIDLDLTLSNDDSIQFQQNFDASIFYLNMVIDGKQHKFIRDDFDEFAGSTGTVTGDLLLMYKKILIAGEI